MRKANHTIRLDDEAYERLQDEVIRLKEKFSNRFTISDVLRYWIPKNETIQMEKSP